jgi:hypothetical protein
MIIEITSGEGKVVDRGYAPPLQDGKYTINSLLDQKDYVYTLRDIPDGYVLSSPGVEETRLLKLYKAIKEELSEEDCKHIHHNPIDSLTILETYILRKLGYTDKYILEEITDKDEFRNKFKSFVDTKHKESITKINDLIASETDQEIIDEYKLVLEDLDVSIQDFYSSLNTTLSDIYAAPSVWPTLLNPSPFKVFEEKLHG